jgi:hypothetical protein
MEQSPSSSELWEAKHFLRPVNAIEAKGRGKQVRQWLESDPGAVSALICFDDVKLMRPFSRHKPNYPLFQYHQTAFLVAKPCFSAGL